MIAAMLSLRFQRNHLRQTAVLTLLAWVLALLTGMVNACQLQPHRLGPSVPPVPTQGGAAEHGMHASQSLHGDDGDHDATGGHEGPNSDTGKGACLKFCDDESSTIAKGETAQTDLPGMVMVADIDWQPAMSTAIVAIWRSGEQPVSQGPPLFIRFLRLTI